MEYITLAGQHDDGGGPGFDLEAWAPYIAGGFFVVFLFVMFGMRRR